MADGGGNQVTKEEFVTHEFDPFKDTTRVIMNFPVRWSMADVKWTGLSGVAYAGTLERFQSAGEETVDAPRMVIDGLSFPASHEEAMERWDAVRISEIIFNVDQENIAVEEIWSNVGDIVLENEALEHYCAMNQSLIIFNDKEQIRKIAAADNLEMRVMTEKGYLDLDDAEEEKIQDAFKLFYNKVYDETAFASEIDELSASAKETIKQEEKAASSGCFVATAVYGTATHPDLDTLRTFRDDFLGETKLGRQFIKFYYKYGPSMAQFVRGRGLLKGAVYRAIRGLVSILRKFD